METISITRALSQLKLLDSRIGKEIMSSRFVGLYQDRNKVINGTTLKTEEFEKQAKSEKQSISDLIDRRRKLKSAIMLSNSTTKVEISGEQYYVVEAIDRKNSIEYEKAFLKKMREQYAASLNSMEVHNQKLEKSIDEMVKANLGADKASNKNDYDNIAKPLRDQNELKLCDPLKINTVIEEMDKKIDEFLSEVDFILSESNAKTTIEI